jgi:hypothetical protein
LELLLSALKKDELAHTPPPGQRAGFYQQTISDFQEHGLIAFEHVGFSGRRYRLTQAGQDVAVAYRNLTRLVQVVE